MSTALSGEGRLIGSSPWIAAGCGGPVHRRNGYGRRLWTRWKQRHSRRGLLVDRRPFLNRLAAPLDYRCAAGCSGARGTEACEARSGLMPPFEAACAAGTRPVPSGTPGRCVEPITADVLAPPVRLLVGACTSTLVLPICAGFELLRYASTFRSGRVGTCSEKVGRVEFMGRTRWLRWCGTIWAGTICLGEHPLHAAV